LSTKQLLLPIRALCTGQSLLTSAEEIALVSIIKNSKIPPYVTVLSGGKEKELSQQSVKESMRSRCDLSTSILEQLTMPLQDFSSSSILTSESSIESANKNANAVVNETHSDTKVCTSKYYFFIIGTIIFFLSYIVIYIILILHYTILYYIILYYGIV